VARRNRRRTKHVDYGPEDGVYGDVITDRDAAVLAAVIIALVLALAVTVHSMVLWGTAHIGP